MIFIGISIMISYVMAKVNVIHEVKNTKFLQPFTLEVTAMTTVELSYLWSTLVRTF